MNTTDCIFCKIIAGEIPADKVYEDEHTLAFLDIMPINPGHTLVIPKNHHENIFTLPQETLGHMMKTIKKISMAIKESLHIENINLGMNNGKIAGQVVFHAHVHVMPRIENDGHILWHGKPYGAGESAKIAEQLKKAL
ncbi:MAG: HIT family protein [bacterium]